MPRPFFAPSPFTRTPRAPQSPQVPQIAGGGDAGMMIDPPSQLDWRTLPGAWMTGQGHGAAPALGDNNDRGGQGFAPNGGGGGSGGFSMQDILASQANVQPHGYMDLPRQFFDPKEMAIGAAVGQLPMGGMLANMGGAMYGAATGNPRSNADIGRGFASSLPGVGGLMKLSEWYAGTPYAKNNPIASYYMGGNADPEAAKYTDSAYRSGFNPSQMQSLYDAIAGQKNLGGAGNVQGAIDAWRASNFNDGKIHIGEKGLENPYSFDMTPSTQIDNSGQGVTFAPQAGPDTGMPDASQSGGGNEPGGYIDMGDGSQTIDNSGVGVSGDGNGGIDWGYAKGGRVRRPMPGMIDPPGPDDQMAPLQSGEGVINRAQMKKLGPKFLAALNAGNFDRKTLMAAVRKAAA